MAPTSDVSEALATLQARWGAAAPRRGGELGLAVEGALALARRCRWTTRTTSTGPAPGPARARRPLAPVVTRRARRTPAADADGRVVPTGFAALDAILGTGGLPRSATVALRGDASSGKTTVALRLAAEAQAAGAIVAWLDLARAFDPVEAVARGIRPEWLVVLTPVGPRGGPRARRLRCSRPGPWTCWSWTCPTAGTRRSAAKRVGDRLGRLAALARRAGTLLVVAGAGRARAGARGGRRGGERPAPGAAADRLDPAGPGRGGAAQRGDGRAQPLRAAGPARGPRDPVRGGRRPGRLPRRARSCWADPPRAVEPPAPPGPPATAPPPRHRSERPPSIGRYPCACCTCSGPTCPSASPGPASESPGSDGTSASWPPGPIVLGGQPWTDGTVVDADPLARALGVRRGIPLGSAHRLAPEATFLDLAPEADRDAVEAACERLAAFSPGIAGTSDVTDPAFGRIAVHVDGLTRLWGIEETLVARMGEALAPRAARARRGPGSRARASPRRVAAAHAPEGGPPILVPPGDDERFLAPYPARLLTRDADVRARLARFGLRTIGSVAELPRSALVARFGDEGARLHARARGEETERFRPRRDPRADGAGACRSTRRPRGSTPSGSSSAGSRRRWPTSCRRGARRRGWPASS